MTVKEAKKKAETINYIQFDGDNADEIAHWMGSDNYAWNDEKLTVVTMHGHMIASKGDYIVKGNTDDFYPYPENIFLEKYDI